MKKNEKLKTELSSILKEGNLVLASALKKEQERRKEDREGHDGRDIRESYQNWYAKAFPVIKILAPERLDEFYEQYKVDKRKEVTIHNYGISDFIMGYSAPTRYDSSVYDHVPQFDPFMVFFTKIEQQISIFQSVLERLDSTVTDIESFLQADLFDHELESAGDLLSKGHLRAAGAIVGVVIEGHLSKVCAQHKITFRKKFIGMSDYNASLKEQGIVDVPTWRLISRLADIRNICVHKKDRDPKKDEVEDLIAGAKKIISEIF